MSAAGSRLGNGRLRARVGIVLSVGGFFLFTLGAEPALFGVDRSPITGFVQILVFLGGLGIMCIGGYTCLSNLWNGYEKTIAADIGLRLVSTGYVVAFGSALADIFGFGSQMAPLTPYFGPWQARGVMLGQLIIAIGFILMYPFGQNQQS